MTAESIAEDLERLQAYEAGLADISEVQRLSLETQRYVLEERAKAFALAGTSRLSIKVAKPGHLSLRAWEFALRAIRARRPEYRKRNAESQMKHRAKKARKASSSRGDVSAQL